MFVLLQLASAKQVDVNTFCFSLPQVPTASVFVDGATALNRVRWSHTGKEIATGDSEGQVQVFDVGEVSSTLIHFGCMELLRPHAEGLLLETLSSLRSKSASPRPMNGRASSGRWPRSTRTETRPRSWPMSDDDNRDLKTHSAHYTQRWLHAFIRPVQHTLA